MPGGHGGVGAHRADAADDDVAGRQGVERGRRRGRRSAAMVSQLRDLRAGGERHRVHPAGDHRLGQAHRGPRVVGEPPLVDGHLDDLGAGGPQPVEPRAVGAAVELHGHAVARQRRRSSTMSTASASRSLRPRATTSRPWAWTAADAFGPAGVDGGAGAARRAARRRGPSSRRRANHERMPMPVLATRKRGRPRDDVVGGRPQPVLGAEGQRADGRAVQHRRAPPLEQRGLLVPAPVGGDADREAVQHAAAGWRARVSRRVSGP